jgi:hypothetical protein
MEKASKNEQVPTIDILKPGNEESKSSQDSFLEGLRRGER